MEMLSKMDAHHNELVKMVNFHCEPFPSTSECYDENYPNCFSICEFSAKFEIHVGPVGRVDEYEGEYIVSVRDNPTNIDDDALLALYPDDDEWNIQHLEDLDCKTRYGSWCETRRIFMFEYILDYSGFKELPVDMLPPKFYRWPEKDVEHYEIEGYNCQLFTIEILNEEKSDECAIHASLSENKININDSDVLGMMEYESEAYKKLFECPCTENDWDLKKFILATLEENRDYESNNVQFYKYTK